MERFISRSRARRLAVQTLEERDRAWKQMIESGEAFKLNEDCIRAHVLFFLGVLNEVEDLPTVLQARIAWEQMQEGATGKVHPNIIEARKRVAEIKRSVDYNEDQPNLEVEADDGITSKT